jgi:hypothetical protein
MAQANNKIQIKRSTANAVVTGLANGELAFTQASNTLFIGLPDGSGVVPIGGARYPGTLTANQALVANSTSGIDKIIVANAALSKIYTTANGYGSAGYILAVDGTGNVYWTSPGSVAVTPAGSNTYVQFNDSGSLGATAGFTFNKASNTLSVANTISTVEIQISGRLKANGSYGTTDQVLYSNSSGGVYWVAATPATNVDAQYAWTNTQSFSNTITFNGAILANTVNATSYTAGVYGSGTRGLVANSSTIAVGNSSVNGSISTNSTVAYFTGTTNNALYLGGTAASSYATQSYVTGLGYITSAALSGYATESYVTSQGYITSAALSGYASETYANDKAANAYSNAMSDTLSRSGTYTGNNIFSGANTNISGYLTSANSKLGNLSVSGNTITAGAYERNNIDFAAGNKLIISGGNYGLDLRASNNGTDWFTLTLNGNTGAFTPSANGTMDLGSATKRFGTLYLAGSTLVIGNSTISVDSSNNVSVDRLLANNATVNNIIGTTTNISSNLAITAANIVASSAQLNVRDAVVSGNLTVQGTLTTLDTTNLQVKDNSIKLADQQASTGSFVDTLDFTVYGTFGNTSNTQFAGFYRDHGASSGVNSVFKLFTSNTEPGGTVDNTSPGYVLGTLNSYLTTGAFVANSSVVNITANSTVSSALVANSAAISAFVANSSVVNITANSTVSSALVANSLTLSTALAASYGGTGQSSYTAGDFLYASGSTTLSKLAIGSPGTVLQVSDANLPAYYSLDGGQF